MNTKTKVLVASGTAAAVLATGGVAVAATSSPATTAGHGHAAHQGHGSGHPALHKIEHGQFVSTDKTGAQVTHEIVDGAVTAVSGTSIAVKDGTGSTTTFVVGAATHVHVQGQAKGASSTISDVHTGGTVTVLGTGTGPYDATKVFVH